MVFKSLHWRVGESFSKGGDRMDRPSSSNLVEVFEVGSQVTCRLMAEEAAKPPHGPNQLRSHLGPMLCPRTPSSQT